MSIQGYWEKVMFDDREHTRNESPATLSAQGYALECTVVLKVSRGRDKETARASTFTVVGNSSSTFAGIVQYASIVAEHIAKLSKGVMSGLYLKMGKYRPDEIPGNVPTGDNFSAVIDLSNNANDEIGLAECAPDRGLYPANVAGTRLYIPFVRDDISKVDIMGTIDSLNGMQVTAGTYYLGQTKFGNENTDQIIAYPCKYIRNYFIKGTSRKAIGYLANNDVQLGLTPDNISSELYATVDQSFADDGQVDPQAPLSTQP